MCHTATLFFSFPALARTVLVMPAQKLQRSTKSNTTLMCQLLIQYRDQCYSTPEVNTGKNQRQHTTQAADSCATVNTESRTLSNDISYNIHIATSRQTTGKTVEYTRTYVLVSETYTCIKHTLNTDFVGKYRNVLVMSGEHTES